MSKTLCPFCSVELDESLYNGAYGCDSGCEYVNIEISCPNCEKVTWSSGKFGSYDDATEKEEYRQGFLEEFAREIERIKKESQQ